MRVPADVGERLSVAQGGAFDTWFESYGLVVDSIRAELYKFDRRFAWYEHLSPGRRAVLILDTLEAEVNNGGLDQYYLNSSGDGAQFAPESLRFLGLDDLAAFVERANAMFPAGVPVDRALRLEAMEGLEGTWDAMDDEFYAMDSPDGGFALAVGTSYILAHQSEFFY